MFSIGCGRGGAAVPLLLLLLLLSPRDARPQERAGASVAPGSISQLREWDARIERMLRSGELRTRTTRQDTVLEGRIHERADQYHRGVRVVGGDVVRQLQDGQLISAFGVVYPEVAIDTNPRITPEAARGIVEQRSGETLGPSREPELVILPQESGFALVWRLRVASKRDVRQYFVDARDGTVVLEYSDRRTQVAAGTIGVARGVLGDQKKISVSPNAAGFVTSDTLRPPSLKTYDMRGDWRRVIDYLNGIVELGTSDLAADTDNDWTDGATGDAHVYTGWTYDYFYKRFNRRGLDDRNIPIVSLVHPARRIDIFELYEEIPDFYLNAFYAGDGIMVYGVGLPAGITIGSQAVDFFSGALDIVAHELAHGVTEYSSDLIYRNESGALNESFSDVMGTSVEFFFQRPGGGSMQADYLIGEDIIRPGGIRSMANPGVFGDPDHYSRRYRGPDDNGGVHVNSGIPNHAFYLAVEGGTNRTSGRSVTGVGAHNREQIEKVFYRAFTQMLPSNATFALARAATLQAARDLFGSGSNAERAMQEAWSAVGVE